MVDIHCLVKLGILHYRDRDRRKGGRETKIDVYKG